MRARASYEFSPMPPEKTRISSPPSAADRAPIAFLALVKEEGDGLGRPWIVVLPREQVAKIGARFRDAKQTRFVVHQRMKLLSRRTESLGEKLREPRIDIARRAWPSPRPRLASGPW